LMCAIESEFSRREQVGPKAWAVEFAQTLSFPLVLKRRP
jgi:hypothetical protein